MPLKSNWSSALLSLSSNDFQQLLGAEELGDRRHLQFLHCLQQLTVDAVWTDGAFLRELFLQRLLLNVRMVLAAANDTVPISELANLANRIMEVATPSLPTMVSPNISAVGPSSHSFNLDKLRAEITSLKEEVKSLHCSTRECSHRRHSPSPVSDSSDMCWYHQKFGSSAQKCCAPCFYSGNASASHWWQPVSPATRSVVYFTLLTEQLDYVFLWTPEPKLVSSHWPQSPQV